MHYSFGLTINCFYCRALTASCTHIAFMYADVAAADVYTNKVDVNYI